MCLVVHWIGCVLAALSILSRELTSEIIEMSKYINVRVDKFLVQVEDINSRTIFIFTEPAATIYQVLFVVYYLDKVRLRV